MRSNPLPGWYDLQSHLSELPLWEAHLWYTCEWEKYFAFTMWSRVLMCFGNNHFYDLNIDDDFSSKAFFTTLVDSQTDLNINHILIKIKTSIVKYIYNIFHCLQLFSGWQLDERRICPCICSRQIYGQSGKD